MKIGFFGMLGIVFIILKLCNVITWSWWLVLLPLYGGFALVYGLGILMAIFGFFIMVLHVITGGK